MDEKLNPHQRPRRVRVCPPHPSNMLTLTIVRPIDLVAPLNINGNFYNTAIIWTGRFNP